MARARKAKKAKARTGARAKLFRPTGAREAHNDFQSAGAAVRVVPVIDTLLRQGRITQAEYDALNHYRQQAHRAEDDMAQSSVLDPQRMMGGGGGSFGSKLPVGVLLATPAIIECARLERELANLLGIARAVAVEDMTLTRWAIHASGGREQARKCGRVDIVPADPTAVDKARLQLRFAAARIRD